MVYYKGISWVYVQWENEKNPKIIVVEEQPQINFDEYINLLNSGRIDAYAILSYVNKK